MVSFSEVESISARASRSHSDCEVQEVQPGFAGDVGNTHLHDELLDFQLVVEREIHERVGFIRRDLAARNDSRLLQPAFHGLAPPYVPTKSLRREDLDLQQHQRFPFPLVGHPQTCNLPTRSLQLHPLPVVPLPLPKPILLPSVRSSRLGRVPKDVEALEEGREGDAKGRFGARVG